MKVKVLRKYKDKHTGNLHNINEELTITKERFEEINSTALGAFVEEVKEEIKEEITEEKPNKKITKKPTKKK